MLELNKDSVAILGVQEHDRLAVRADLGLRSEAPDLVGLDRLDGIVDVVHLDADVVEAAVLVALKEGADRALLAEWVQELQLGVAEVNKDGRHAVLGEGLIATAVSYKNEQAAWTIIRKQSTYHEHGTN